jgi:hypothetical protein
MAYDITYIQALVEHDLGMTLDSGKIQQLADRVYAEELPVRIGDGMSKRTLTFDTVVGTADYDLTAKATANGFILWTVREELVLLDNLPIFYSTDPEQFWLIHQHGASQQQKPTACLLDAFTLTLFPTPSDIWAVKLWVSGSRVSPFVNVASQLEADAIAKAVTFYYGSSLGMDEAAAAALEVYNAMMRPLHRMYGGHVQSQPMMNREF